MHVTAVDQDTVDPCMPHDGRGRQWGVSGGGLARLVQSQALPTTRSLHLLRFSFEDELGRIVLSVTDPHCDQSQKRGALQR